jgi:TonB family protein
MSRRPRFRWRNFALAALAALLMHAEVIPRVFLPLLERPERPVEIAFVDEDPESSGQPPELDKLDLPRPEVRDRRPPAAPSKPERPEKVKPPTPPRPTEKVVVVEKPREPPPPPPPPEQELVHQKMVDQDKFPDEADNAEARYLAQKNHRAARDTRALNTNLVRDSVGPTSSPTEKSDLQQPEIGMKDRKTAELQRRAGQERKVVRSTPTSGDEGKSERTTPGKLSMRGLVPRSVEQQGPQLTPREGMELHDRDAGQMAAAREGNAGERSGTRRRGARVNLSLGALDYDKIVGESVARAERDRGARAEVSHAEGRWARLERKQAAMRSALENFTPEAYVGRESELGTRAHPYASFIAQMHQAIHKLWAFSFLPSLDGRGALDPYNDMTRYTRIAIILKDSGELESANILRPSGYLPFDAAALDVVMSAAPFPKPPEAIRSYDGKVYLDWVFHRDGRQCGTDFVVPHILNRDRHGALEPAASGSVVALAE